MPENWKTQRVKGRPSWQDLIDDVKEAARDPRYPADLQKQQMAEIQEAMRYAQERGGESYGVYNDNEIEEWNKAAKRKEIFDKINERAAGKLLSVAQNLFGQSTTGP